MIHYINQQRSMMNSVRFGRRAINQGLIEPIFKMGAHNRLQMTSNHLFSTTSVSQNDYTSISQGSKYTTNFKNYCVDGDGKVISYFHDIPMGLNWDKKTVHMVVEIPRWSNGKFEVSTQLPGNPIVQDIKKGNVRFVRNLFPHHGYIHNYGSIPQTWEDPAEHPEFELFGDNDPLDVCEIGTQIGKLGEIKNVKVLGSLALVDDGELDWKVIVIDTKDPIADKLHDIHDVYHVCPGLLESTRHWFKNYKLPDLKPQNKYMFNGEYKNQADTMAVIKECHEAWLRLIAGKATAPELPSISNATVSGSPGFQQLDSSAFLNVETQPDGPKPLDVDKVFYIPIE